MTAAAGPVLRRSWPQRILITFNCLLITACLVAAAALGYFYQRFGQLPRYDFAEGVLDEEDPGEPQNFLLVGSDTRAFTAGDDQAQESFGSEGLVGGERADTIMLIRVDPRAESAAMVSFPRDLLVEVAGTGKKDRINAAFQGGPEQLIRTITMNFDIRVHHYVQVDFAGFKGMVDAVGGVELYLPAPVRDRAPDGSNPSGLNITDSGCVRLSGDQALSYVRSRHFQYMEDDRWKSDPSGDIGRITRQQDFIRRAMREAISKDLLNPSRVNKLVDVGIDNVTVDRDLDARDIVNLGERFRSLTPESLQQFTLPIDNATVRGASVLVLQEGQETEDILDVFRGIAPVEPGDVAPSAVTVRVLNGTGVPGQASGARDDLVAAGFAVTSPGDGPGGTEATVIRYGAGQGAKAQLLARYLEPEVQLREDPDLTGVDAVILTGETFVGVRTTPRPASEVPQVDDTTTTEAPAEDESPLPTIPEC
ncbi:MAG: LCP family protein [Acidimicrobiales bacterium]